LLNTEGVDASLEQFLLSDAAFGCHVLDGRDRNTMLLFAARFSPDRSISHVAGPPLELHLPPPLALPPPPPRRPQEEQPPAPAPSAQPPAPAPSAQPPAPTAACVKSLAPQPLETLQEEEENAVVHTPLARPSTPPATCAPPSRRRRRRRRRTNHGSPFRRTC
jgi:hypothetical protein